LFTRFAPLDLLTPREIWQRERDFGNSEVEYTRQGSSPGPA